MRKLIPALLLNLLISPAFAQSGMEYLYSPKESLLNGLRAGVVKGFFDARKASGSGSVSADVEQTLGLKVGFARIQPGNIGFLGHVTMHLFDDISGDSGQIYRLDGNVAYGFGGPAFGYAGVNIAKVSESVFDPGFGFQIGAGFQFHENFGIDLSYNTSTFGIDLPGSNLNIAIDSIEIALMANF